VAAIQEALELVADVRNLPARWAAELFSRTLRSWEAVPDSALPVSNEFIAERAYYLFLDRGAVEGDDLADWFRAERELQSLFREYTCGLNEASDVESTGHIGSDSSCLAEEPINCVATDVQSPPLKGIETRDWALDTGERQDGKMGDMIKTGGLNKDSMDAGLVNYRDSIREMTAEERNRFRGKVLAILVETGKIIAAEETPEELKKAVDCSQFRGRRWRLMDGPGDEPPLTVGEFLALHDDGKVEG